jgi:ribosome maturation protein SDO1
MVAIDKSVVARIVKKGKHFEILVDPEAVQKYKTGKTNNINEVLVMDDIFTESRKGTRAPKALLESNFGTSDVIEIAKIILKDGEVHTTEAQRVKEKDDKWDKIVSLITMNAVDPKTHNPIPKTTINDALKQAGFKVDERKVEDQLQEAIKKMKPVLAFKFEEKKVQVNNLPAHIAGSCLEIAKKFGSVENQQWGSDKSLSITIVLPAGLLEDFTDKLNQLTHGKTEMKFI